MSYRRYCSGNFFYEKWKLYQFKRGLFYFYGGNQGSRLVCQALKNKNKVAVGSFNKKITLSKYGQNPFYIAVVISPDIRVDNSGRIETAMLIVVSDLEKIIKFDMKDDLIGNTILLDEENQVLYDPAGKADLIEDIADINYFLNGLCQRTGRFLAGVAAGAVKG